MLFVYHHNALICLSLLFEDLLFMSGRTEALEWRDICITCVSFGNWRLFVGFLNHFLQILQFINLLRGIRIWSLNSSIAIIQVVWLHNSILRGMELLSKLKSDILLFDAILLPLVCVHRGWRLFWLDRGLIALRWGIWISLRKRRNVGCLVWLDLVSLTILVRILLGISGRRNILQVLVVLPELPVDTVATDAFGLIIWHLAFYITVKSNVQFNNYNL